MDSEQAMISEIVIPLGRSDRSITLPVTVLDTLQPFKIRFDRKIWKIAFVGEYLFVSNGTLLGAYVRGNNGLRVRRVGTDVFWSA